MDLNWDAVHCHVVRDRAAYFRSMVAIVIVVMAYGAASATITTTGNISPAYPGGEPDPWSPGSELVIGNTANGSLNVSGGSDIVSAGGTVAFNPNVIGSAGVPGSGSGWA